MYILIKKYTFIQKFTCLIRKTKKERIGAEKIFVIIVYSLEVVSEISLLSIFYCKMEFILNDNRNDGKSN